MTQKQYRTLKMLVKKTKSHLKGCRLVDVEKQGDNILMVSGFDRKSPLGPYVLQPPFDLPSGFSMRAGCRHTGTFLNELDRALEQRVCTYEKMIKVLRQL